MTTRTDAPILSNEQKLVILNHSKDVEIATLKMQRCQDVLDRYIQSIVPEGYELTNAMELKKRVEPESATSQDAVS